MTLLLQSISPGSQREETLDLNWTDPTSVVCSDRMHPWTPTVDDLKTWFGWEERSRSSRPRTGEHARRVRGDEPPCCADLLVIHSYGR